VPIEKSEVEKPGNLSQPKERLLMNDKRDENNRTEGESSTSDQSASDANETAETESGADDYEIDKKNRGERPDNLRRRSEWFQKRTGGR